MGVIIKRLLCVSAIFGLGFHGVSAQSVSVAFLPNDPEYFRLDYLRQTKIDGAWDVVRAHLLDREVVVAVLDTGVDIDHPDLANSIWVNDAEIPEDGIDNDGNSFIDDVHGWDFLQSVPDPRPKFDDGYTADAINHGTVVAGILAAEADNNIGIPGAGLRVKIMPIRVLDSKGAGSTLLLSQAIDYAVENGADVINLSLVGQDRDWRLEESIEQAYKSGVAIVAASGNQDATGVDLNISPRYPICEQEGVNRIIGVAAVDEQLRLAPFSNYGSECIDVAAPGVNFYSTVVYDEKYPGFDKYYSDGWTGTSAAAPLISATLAMIRQVAPQLPLSDVYRALLTSSRTLSAANIDPGRLGAGLLDGERALLTAIDFSRAYQYRAVLASGSGFQPRVFVKDETGATLSELFAYGKKFQGGVAAVIGNVDEDSSLEVVTAPLSLGGPHIRVFHENGELESQFMAYDPKYRGGYSIAVGDVTGDGIGEIIVAPLRGGGPHVRVFTKTGALLGEFFAYAEQFRGGVRVATVDIDNDRIDDIVTVPESDGGPHVRIFDIAGHVKSQFMAFDPSLRGGLTLAVGDVDSDGAPEFAVAQIIPRDIQVRIFKASGEEKNRFLLYSGLSGDEIPSELATSDVTGDGQPEIISHPLTLGAVVTASDFFGRIVNVIDFAGANTADRAIRFSFDFNR